MPDLPFPAAHGLDPWSAEDPATTESWLAEAEDERELRRLDAEREVREGLAHAPAVSSRDFGEETRRMIAAKWGLP